MNVPAMLPENQYVLPGVPESFTPAGSYSRENPLNEYVVKGDSVYALLDALELGEEVLSSLDHGSPSDPDRKLELLKILQNGNPKSSHFYKFIG